MKKNKKKKYIKPKITSEKIFEQASLACGKCISGNPIFISGCRFLPRLS
ncbi:MAG: hypothetical protein RMJ67_06920 [Elusimicrobiota bacterium]|nr:hypothetical protein [Endomicrobiia bacterium]MCX7910603.1 hypothetical protein [Endomicrobiia bacterium]MDW8166226.1 hypothetical protein [Elusimicrobiota bacterium]